MADASPVNFTQSTDGVVVKVPKSDEIDRIIILTVTRTH